MIDLRLGDCLEVMREIPDGSVSAIVTDPPYGQSNESYDAGVPAEVWRECFRVARDNAALLSFAGSPTYHRIASGIEAAGWRVRQMWAWVYRDGMITSAYPREGFDRLAPAMDPICFATRGKVLLNLEREGDAWTHTVEGRGVGMSARSSTCSNLGADGHWPRSLAAEADVGFQYFALKRSLRGERDAGHPNQKPLALMRWLVGKLPRGGTILDPYAGSGTTLIAAEELGFDAIGIEVDPEYHAAAERRIAEAVSRYPLFGDPDAIDVASKPA